jgi:putative methionine-R-sulfoxide reductase with GAF domain
MAQVNSYEGRVGFLKIAVAALADNGTEVITLPDTCEGRVICQAIDDSGNVVPIVAAGGTGVSIVIDADAKTVTFKNETGAALTGEFQVIALD